MMSVLPICCAANLRRKNVLSTPARFSKLKITSELEANRIEINLVNRREKAEASDKSFHEFLWLAQDMRPALAVASGESLVVLVEGFLIYLICRFVPTSKENLPRTSLVRCWLASLVGNACSLIAFPFLTNLYDFISRR
jgi:hypothetical protein